MYDRYVTVPIFTLYKNNKIPSIINGKKENMGVRYAVK